MDAAVVDRIQPTASPVLRGALAPQQRGLWFVQQLAPDCGAYHLVFSLRLEGVALTEAKVVPVLRQLMDDYPVLRAQVEVQDELPMQTVDLAAQPNVCWHSDCQETEEQLRERVRTDTRRPFDLAVAPLWRVHVYAKSPQSFVIAVAVHHLLLDFWSLGLLLSELAARFQLLPRAERVIDGSGFLSSESGSKDHQAALAYWRDALRDAPAVHSLPLDAQRPPVQTYSGRSRSFVLNATTSTAIQALARTHNATPFMVLLAAYFVWLYRLSGDADLVVASPVAGRASRRERAMLGQFVNTLPLRAQLDAKESFTTLLARVRGTVIEALRYQDCPYPTLVEHLAPQRDPSHPPLTQLGFSWERLPLMAEFAQFFLPNHPGAHGDDAARQFGAARLVPFPVPQQEGQLDLLLEMGGEVNGAYIGVLKYHDALFQEATIDAWLASWQCLLDGIAAQPDCALGDLPMLAAPSALLGPSCQWSCAHTLDLVEAAVRAHAEAEAVADGTRSLTYAQLWQRAQAIGAHLRAQGVRSGDHVGLMLDRTVDLPAAMLGIWCAGAAYVPLDPTFPRERLNDIAADAQLTALVTETQWQALWPTVAHRLVLDADSLSTLPQQPINRSEVAYLIYTSGSTGKPKGVRIGHAAVVNFLLSMQAQPWTDRPIDHTTRLLAITTPAFDISVLELWLPLLVGGTTVVCARAVLTDGVQLAQWLEARQINMLQATPATWKMLIDAGWQGRAELVALCGGEPLPRLLATQLQARSAALWNMYGPTETTVWSTAVRIHGAEPIHLGPPIANTQLYVLDERQQPVPPGVLGELWIGGAGLALDYWQRPELTAERFCTPAPWRDDQAKAAERLYRTGDRVRINAQGRLEHHGRLDFQIKLRGFRIELGEIEAQLKRQPDVTDAVVIVREDQPGNPLLVAYLVADQAQVKTADLQTALQAVLPAYMLPSAWMFLDALPQTPNKKIDRKALPAPQAAVRLTEAIPPRDTTEIQLVALFERGLNVAPVGIHDNFFDLGGHSLLAVQLVAEIRRTFNVELPVSELLTHGTVAALAQRLRSDAVADGNTDCIVLRRALREASHPADSATAPLWLFHPIGGTVFCYLELARRLHPQRPVHAIQAPGLERAGEAEVTVEAMAQRYLTMLRAHQPHGPYLLGGWCFGGVVAYEAARQLRAQGEVIGGIVLIDTRAPIAANVPSDGDDAMLLSWFARDLAVPYGKALTIEPDTLRALPPEAMFDAVLEAAKAIDVLAADADRDQLYRYFEVYIANAMALQMYFPPAENLPVLLLRAQDEPLNWGPNLGWRELAPRTLTQLDLPGDHNSIVYAPNASAVARTIDQRFPPTAILEHSQIVVEHRQAA